jgi:YHS domain-containing protein
MNTSHTLTSTAQKIGRARRHLLAAALAASAGLIPLAALAAEAVNVDAKGVAVHGYDPVAYFVMGKPVKGTPEFSAAWKGATYWFANASHLQTFRTDPARYEPQYGGYCAFGVAQGAKPDIDPTAFAVVDGKLYLNLSAGVQRRWQADVPGHIRKADQNWSSLKDR